ncbi:MAG: hypothetical protein ACRDPG_00885, partial [Nocardioidaceae bacterium]
PRLLRAVYTPRSPELRADQAMLRSYLARGVRVTGVRMSFSQLAVESQQGGSVRLVVVDRLGPAIARNQQGRAHLLPRDRSTRHRLVLRRVDGQWRIAAVRRL